MTRIQVRFPARLPSSRDLICLPDLLRLVDRSGLRWVLFELEAIAETASGIDVVELEQQVLDAPSGVAVTPDDLARWASGIRQFINLELRGIDEESEEGHSQHAAVLLTAHDSTEWSLDVEATRVDPSRNPGLWSVRY